ncbi:MAG: 6,7-dimethyl-8-ribityllumazine synthase, partial [Proteobacteria bacterium]|nr:6,7-dimethyl-8-ribityllumazine synthase [Pseudomonadota bacterium]
EITEGLYQGASQYLSKQGIQVERIDVSGALEIPLACQILAQSKQFDAIVTIGVVIRGETAHFDHVCEQSARGIMDVSLNMNIPIGNGIITVENEQQALDRSSVGEDFSKTNKGKEAAEAAVTLLKVKQRFET